MSIAHPLPGTISDEQARCGACGEVIKLLVFNWVHVEGGSHTCKDRGDSGAVQQNSGQQRSRNDFA